MSEPSFPADLELVRAVLGGRLEAIERFLERMRVVPRILGATNSRSGSPLGPEELADLGQEIFSTVWQKLPDYRGDARLETWVFPFCQLSFLNWARRANRRRNTMDTAELDAIDEAPPRLDPLDAAAVHAGLARLGDAERQVIRMKQFDGLTFVEIAAQVGLSANTAKTRYYRGLSRLRTMLEDSLSGPMDDGSGGLS